MADISVQKPETILNRAVHSATYPASTWICGSFNEHAHYTPDLNSGTSFNHRAEELRDSLAEFYRPPT